MSRGIPIYLKVLTWLAVNVLVLILLVVGFLRLQFHMSLDWMLLGPAGERISMIGDQVTNDLSRIPESEWAARLKHYDSDYGVTFALFDRYGHQIMGSRLEAPDSLTSKLVDIRAASERESQRRSPPRRPPDKARDEFKGRPPDAPPKPRFMQRTGSPARYWAGIHIDLVYGPDFLPITLVMVSDSITGGGLFIDLRPWAALAAACLTLSAFVWMPFVRGLTRSISQLNKAARTIAQGHFGERVPDKRQDELGELATSVNTMARQLGDYVAQQRRITADVAHELCSPIARMQMALGVIEQRGTPEQAIYLEKIDRELQHMAKLVEEVLTFSKAATIPDRETPDDTNLRDLITAVIAREAPDADIQLEVPVDLHLHALHDALDRAIGNILRNAIRYASHAGPIQIHAEDSNGQTVIRIADQGPGVAPEALSRLFEPFYRPEVARARHTGGSGLGLAIVKRCVEACNGTVSVNLRNPQGLEVKVVIPNGVGVSPVTPSSSIPPASLKGCSSE